MKADKDLDLTPVAFEIENVKRLKAIRLEVVGPTLIVGGRNRQGKTSALDAIEMALRGGDSIPPDPVRHGAKVASTRIDLGDLVVERTIRADRKTALVVRDAEGVEQSSPQKLLDRLVSRLALDPFSFARMPRDQQARVLLDVLGLASAFEQVAAHSKRIYDRRTELGRKLRERQAQLLAMPAHKGVPDTETKAADLLAELERREEGKRAWQALAGEADKASVVADDKAADIDDDERQLAELEAKVVALRQQIGERRVELDRARATANQASRAFDAASYDDPAEIKAQLATVEESNAKVRANVARVRAQLEIAELDKACEQCTTELEQAEEAKRQTLEQAKFPVPGLTVEQVEERGQQVLALQLNGAPVSQASAREQLTLGFALCAAQKPKIRIALLREGAYLDDDGLALVAEVAQQFRFLAIIERVSRDGAGCHVLIEDGEAHEIEESNQHGTK
jgi:hypothetical protein